MTDAGVPARLGKYDIVMPLAHGGMAEIYIARTTGIGSFERTVVLKVIHQAADSASVRMFLEEARLAACLNHQNIAQVFEVGHDQGFHYLAMEFVHGQDLHGLMSTANAAARPIPMDVGLTIIALAAAGLDHAHNRHSPNGTPLGLVHRDVSPSNIMVGYDGSVKLLDFGIAKATGLPARTESGVIKGKFAYMAPEQCQNQEVDRRADVFSLGILLYEITTFHRCFRAKSGFDTMRRIVAGDFLRPSHVAANYPPELEAIVLTALATHPDQRYQTAAAFLEALDAFMAASRMLVSPTSMRRFMVELFGDPPEPWLQPSRTSAPRIAVAPPSDAARDPQPDNPFAPISTVEVRNVESLRQALGLGPAKPVTVEVRDVASLREALGLRPPPSPLSRPSPTARTGTYVMLAGFALGIALALLALRVLG